MDATNSRQNVGMTALARRVRRWPRARRRSASPLLSRGCFIAACALALTLYAVRALRTPGACDTAREAPSTIVARVVPQVLREAGESDRPPEFRVVVLTHSRRESLQRLLSSLRDAEYDGERVDLDVWIDRSRIDPDDPRVVAAAPSAFSRLLPAVLRTFPASGPPLAAAPDADVVDTSTLFSWPHGVKTVHVWDTHVGIWGQWIDSWRPSQADPSEAAVILEDDLEVSPLYYRWLRGARQAYSNRKDVFGYTLQRGMLRANQTGFGRRPLRIPPHEPVYLYQLLGSWGYAPDAQHWAQFRDWFHVASCTRDYHPYVEGLIPTRWYIKQERARSMWTMWHIKYAHARHLFTAYANLQQERTLAASWREPGLHFRNSSSRKSAAGVTKKKDFALLARDDGEEGAGRFSFPSSPIQLAWNGTYIDKNGLRTRY